ncbi:YeeE/YedE family protein [Sinorhizobium garamanticum]|uniref:YeeE/YedE family protein n=1 Tax=Sinorhizobium garamanticum TaxID=680247 RepID=A0ABY8D7M1_9HYPH|nr:YeeE/YedE family protein [Sinorhizobium garamanticum]WEX86879.1 YeeE/YedE family protein [Sinorhizobium garamanticum]
MSKSAGFRVAAAFVSGTIFGLGLALSGMLNPARVRGFLDVARDWDPTLAFVLGGAVAVSAIGMSLARWIRKPLLDERFHLPETQLIDRRLIVGSAIFGVGWGMVGLCPGPAVASLSLGLPATILFLAAMFAGMAAHDHRLGVGLWGRAS